jgi:DNA-binding LacI/PurR family transcriptional regulator
MSDIPRRTSLHDQLVRFLREGIVAGRWKGELPSEKQLCREFQVSRTTLRKALAQLAVERWLKLGGRGRLHRIPRIRMPRGEPPNQGRFIRFLTPHTFAMQGSLMHEILDVIDERLRAAGYRLALECHPGVFDRLRQSSLAHLDGLPETAGWILSFATPSIQRWFAELGRPALLFGRSVDSRLPSIRLDNEAAGRHAAGLLCARGHRNIAYLIETLTSLGDRSTADTFVAEARRLGAQARIVSYEKNPPAVTRCMLGLINSKSRPTAYVVGSSEIAISALCHLQAAGMKVPADASLIAGWSDYHLDLTFPPISHYRCGAQPLGRSIAEMILGLLAGGGLKTKTKIVIPDFFAGGSVGPAPLDL